MGNPTVPWTWREKEIWASWVDWSDVLHGKFMYFFPVLMIRITIVKLSILKIVPLACPARVFSSVGASQDVVVGPTYGHPKFLPAAPWKPVAPLKKTKSWLWPSPAWVRAMLVSWGTFGAEFGSRAWCLLQPGPYLPQSKTDHELPLLCLCRGQKVSSQALSEHGQAEGMCESSLLPTRQPQISKQHESQGGLIYSWCSNLNLSLLPRYHSRRGTEEFLPLSPSQFQMHLQTFIATDHGRRIKVGFKSQMHLVL